MLPPPGAPGSRFGGTGSNRGLYRAGIRGVAAVFVFELVLVEGIAVENRQLEKWRYV